MISIIIPVIDEQEGIGELLHHLRSKKSGKNQLEIIVADGGSTDETQSVVTHFPEVKWVTSERSRAKQMNAGAKASQGNILYFLHADSFPPQNFDQYIKEAVAAKNFAGCFQMKFDSPHWWLTLMGYFTKFNHKSCRGGDQSLFVTRSVFEELEGYDESYIIYEDNHFIGRLYKRTKFKVVRKWLVTSARKYREIGVWKLQWIYVIIYFKKWQGADARQLINYYQRSVRN